MYDTLVISPAYGRDYKTWEEMERDWNAGKDFRGYNLKYSSAYVSNYDLPKDITKLEFRFNHLQDLHIINLVA